MPPEVSTDDEWGGPAASPGHSLPFTLATAAHDLADLEREVGDGGILLMPIHLAQAVLQRWVTFLKSLPADDVGAVLNELRALQALLKGDLEGTAIGEQLLRVGLATRTVGAGRISPLGLVLDRLADGLVAAGQTPIAHQPASIQALH